MRKIDSNPKSKFGIKKPSLSVVPTSSIFQLISAMENGADKYGALNWRENSVSASIYYDAIFRHVSAWWEGENDDAESGASHLAHVMACACILIDAAKIGNLIDDRPKRENV